MGATEKNPFLAGPVFKPLLNFMLPVLLANFLQAMYSAVDLMVIGRFANADTVQLANAAVGTGSMIMVMVTYVITGLAMGTTVVLGQYIGAKDRNDASKVIGSAICIFIVLAVGLTVIMEILAPVFASLMNAPSVEMTTLYLRICCGGLVFITAYNVISGILRGIGNSKLPLLFVGIACVVNITLDLITVCILHWDVAGVAISTITAQVVSVILSLVVIRKTPLPFDVHAKLIRFHPGFSSKILRAGIPLLGYFNGCGHSTFVLIQGLIGSFVVRIPVILLLQNYDGVTLTHLGLGCAPATVTSLLICIGYYIVKTKKDLMFPAHMRQSYQHPNN